MSLLNNFIELFMESAPWLMLGLTIAGLMKGLLPEGLLAKHLGKPGFASTLKAALLGAPLPLCSCGVIPAALGLRRGGASKSATTSFLISTPETGVDSVSISYALLGPFMAVVRPIAAVVSAVTAGVLVGNEDAEPVPEKAEEKSSSCCAKKTVEDAPKAACCSSKSAAGEPALAQEKTCCGGKKEVDPAAADTNDKTEGQPKSSCCGSKTEKTEGSCCAGKTSVPPKATLGAKIKSGLRFTFIDLIKDIAPWLLVGLGFAAVIKTFVPSDFLVQWGDGALAFVVMALIGVPMYICATASTPIAAGLMFSGVSPGAVLVFLLVGPATNIATIGLVKRELGQRALIAYLSSVVGVGFLFGFAANMLAAHWHIDFTTQVHHAHGLVSAPVTYLTSVLLALMMVYGLAGKYTPFVFQKVSG